MKEGTRIKHKDRGFLATVKNIGKSAPPKPWMIRIVRDDFPDHCMWFDAGNFEVIEEPKQPEAKEPFFIHYLVSSVVKIDIAKEGWDAGCDETFGIQKICAAKGYDGLTGKDEEGVHVIGYNIIEKREFDTRKYDLFTEEGGI